VLRKIFGSKREEVKGDKNYIGIIRSAMMCTYHHILGLQIKEDDMGGV
jgi:hypothetical protein